MIMKIMTNNDETMIIMKMKSDNDENMIMKIMKDDNEENNNDEEMTKTMWRK